MASQSTVAADVYVYDTSVNQISTVSGLSVLNAQKLFYTTDILLYAFFHPKAEVPQRKFYILISHETNCGFEQFRPFV